MKKDILLLIAPFLLSGCVVAPLQGTSNQPTQEENGGNQDIEDEGETGGNQETPPVVVEEKDDLEQEYTATIKTSGSDFTSAFSEHTDFINTDYKSELKEYFDKDLEYLNLITSVTYNNINTNKYNNSCHLTLGTGYFVKSKYVDGKLTWNSGVKIYKVVVKAQAYMNSYPGYGAQAGTTVYQPDYPAHILVAGEDIDLSVSETATDTVEKTITKSFAEGVNSFSLESRNARVFVNEITITWRG